MKTVIFTKGIQSSGKSTWATKFVEENQDYKRINRDSIRHMLSNYTFDNKNEELVTVIENNTIKTLLEQGYNLVIDNMNLNNKTVNRQTRLIKSIIPDINIEIKEFPITLNEAIERDSKREFSVGKSVIKRVWNRYEIELKQMLERYKPKYIEDINLPHCCIFDLDGTLSNSVNRGIYNGYDIDKDIVIEPVKTLINIIHNSKKIILFSGRSAEWKEQTINWLNKNNIIYDELYMRDIGDNRCDTIVKSEMFKAHIRGKYYCEFVIDDRVKVLDMWQKMGIFTFDVRQDVYCKNKF